MTELVINQPWKEQSLTLKDADIQDESRETGEILFQKLELAKTEIEENDKIKEQCLQQLKEWISQNGDIENCLTDDNFLLRFLRTRKYSLFMAEQMILKYLNFRKKFVRYMGMMDYLEPNVNDLMSNGYLFASPFRDSEGRRVVIYDIAKFDLQKHSNDDMARAHAIAYETIIEDEETQILGVNHIADMSGISPAFTTLFSVTEFTRLITWGEQSIPLRHKEINLLNVPTALKYVYDYALSKMSKKLRHRFEVHDSFSSLTAKVDKKCLPLEFGGVMPSAEMIQLWKKELSEKRDRLLSMTKMELLSDKGIISRKTIEEHTNGFNMEGLTGCFRKLEVD
ncbi:hypothetical protein HHI36_020691 [Cryptolaemus montrouzieri]|uniref:CRAL-TRIO domain-containing protein n=1 Tax=Cryptolaemus montrouzieri TaxID=559131 RepID=A0ABD2NBH3_9CUCU